MSEPELLTLRASDGYDIAFRRYLPLAGTTTRAVVVYLHGIQSHGGWYDASSRHLAQAGFAVYFADRRGSGLNQVDRGHAPSWPQLARDVTDLEERALTDLWPQAGRLPLFLLAVSWGGKLAAALAAMHVGRYAGLALLCPGICPQRDVSRSAKFRIASCLARGRAMQKFPIPLDDPRLFTATPRWLDFLAHDPLALHEATARFLFESRQLDAYVAEAAEWIRAPAYLALADHDRIIDNAATQRYFARLGSTDKTSRIYPGAHHTLEFEPDPAPG